MSTETVTTNHTTATRAAVLATEPGNNTFVVWYDPNREPYAVYFRSDANSWDDDQRWFNADQAGGDLDGPYSWDNLREEMRGNDGPHLLVPGAEVEQLRAELDGPCGSCHPCTNWADETWRRADRTPPTVDAYDELLAELKQLRASVPA